MSRRLTVTALLAAMVLFSNGCQNASKGSKASDEFLILYAEATDAEAAMLEQQLSGIPAMDGEKQIRVQAMNRQDVIRHLQEGKADCGFGTLGASDGIQYGFQKGSKEKRRQLVLLADHAYTALTEFEKEKVGYPETLDVSLLAYLKSTEGVELHSYRSVTQLLSDLESGFLDAAALEQSDALPVWLEQEELYLSQPEGARAIYSRFFGPDSSRIQYAEAHWKEE